MHLLYTGNCSSTPVPFRKAAVASEEVVGARDGQVPEARLQSGTALESTAMHPGDLGKSEQQESSLASPRLLANLSMFADLEEHLRAIET